MAIKKTTAVYLDDDDIAIIKIMAEQRVIELTIAGDNPDVVKVYDNILIKIQE